MPPFYAIILDNQLQPSDSTYPIAERNTNLQYLVNIKSLQTSVRQRLNKNNFNVSVVQKNISYTLMPDGNQVIGAIYAFTSKSISTNTPKQSPNNS